MNLTLSQFLTYLLSEKNFYAMAANRLKRVFVPGLGTAAVGVQGGRMVLMVDPDFVSKVSMAFGVFVMEHELGHVVWDHIARYLELLSMLPAEGDVRDCAEATYQIAMDCANNALLRNDKHFPAAQAGMRDLLEARLRKAKEEGRVPPEEQLDPKDGLVLPEIYNLPAEGSFESYMHLLLERKEDFRRVLTLQLGGFHIYWIDADSDGEAGNKEGGDKSGKKLRTITHEELQGLAQQIRTQTKQVLRGAVEECRKARGVIPAECTEWLGEFLADPIIPWWDVLTTRVQATKRVRFDRGISRPDRPLMAMAEEDTSIIPAIGLERDPRYRIFFYTDTSGSMHTDSLKIAASEMTHLLRSDEDMEIRVMQGDAETHFDQLFHSGDEIPSEVIGRGGTDFNAYFEYMAQYIRDDDTCPDLVIVYTDGYAPDIAPEYRLPPEIPVIWLVTPHSRLPENYGEVIVCDPSQNELYKEEP